MSATYDFNEIEPRWQHAWSAQRAFAAANPRQPGSEKPKYYILDFFPYPSGAGLHVGHPLGYIATDIISRYKRMRGFNVLHPMGWDAFGLPAEQYAIETGVHPAITTRKNIETYKRQLSMIGLSYDWDREVATCNADYYRWTQWIFLQIYNSWYDPEYRWTDAFGREQIGSARPIDTLPIPPHVREQGDAEIEPYKDDHRLGYLAEVPVNWCPQLGTVLANEEVTAEGRSDRGNYPVFRRPMKQWMLRITEYADRLAGDLDHLDWPEPIKLMQRNWIGRSEGAHVDFTLADDGENVIRVYTTRPDTLYGATYMVLAPEHTLVSVIATAEQRGAVEAYVEQARRKSELDRTVDAKTKTGVFTGAYAINPVSRAKIPIWVADYVLVSYGTGSIMAVPGSDRRDLEFADNFGLPVIQVVRPPDAAMPWRGFEDHGFVCNSPSPETSEIFEGQCDLNGLSTAEAKERITTWLGQRDLGEGTTQYKLRDWLFSRQRYWGEPFPILHGADGRIIGEDASRLPVTLPEMQDFRPQSSDDPEAEPATPLSRAADWSVVERDGRSFQREKNTMPQWAGSCWYYLRFCDPQNDKAFAGADAEQYWMRGKSEDGAPKFGGVDLYVGGAEHAVLHLLYARFWHKVLFDLGHVSTPEPFHKLFNQGYIQAHAYRDERGHYVEAAEVVDESGTPAAEAQDRPGPFFHNGAPVTREYGKIGKSLKNVVNPDQVAADYGADTLRLYEMYMGPLEASKPWNPRDIIGVHRFLQRVWRLLVESTGDTDDTTPETAAHAWVLNPKIGDVRDGELERLLHKTIRKVGEDVEKMAFNTAIAQMIVWINAAQKAPTIARDQIERFLIMLSAFAPHVSEELWRRLGHDDLICLASWPEFDAALTVDESVEVAVQIKGKVRARITVPQDADEDQHVALAKQDPAIARMIAGQEIRRAIVVRGRLVNLII
jgi:leucyl-tRNA synthetase